MAQRQCENAIKMTSLNIDQREQLDNIFCCKEKKNIPSYNKIHFFVKQTGNTKAMCWPCA